MSGDTKPRYDSQYTMYWGYSECDINSVCDFISCEECSQNILIFVSVNIRSTSLLQIKIKVSNCRALCDQIQEQSQEEIESKVQQVQEVFLYYVGQDKFLLEEAQEQFPLQEAQGFSVQERGVLCQVTKTLGGAFDYSKDEVLVWTKPCQSSTQKADVKLGPY